MESVLSNQSNRQIVLSRIASPCNDPGEFHQPFSLAIDLLSNPDNFSRLDSDEEIGPALKKLLMNRFDNQEMNIQRVKSLLEITANLDMLVLLEDKWQLSGKVLKEEVVCESEILRKTMGKLRSRLELFVSNNGDSVRENKLKLDDNDDLESEKSCVSSHEELLQSYQSFLRQPGSERPGCQHGHFIKEALRYCQMETPKEDRVLTDPSYKTDPNFQTLADVVYRYGLLLTTTSIFLSFFHRNEILLV